MFISYNEQKHLLSFMQVCDKYEVSISNNLLPQRNYIKPS
jgi:hypothetical protein